MPRLTTDQRRRMLERAAEAAHAARTLDPHDRYLLDMAHMGAELDDADLRRLATNPLARAYAPGLFIRESVPDGAAD
jgi:hypothetical protein